ncbi:hypothetical protein JXM67_04030 [candidate division WOR-3 bacterium]|nr:hypothetical protein [candidate division WOR-3 bacterium]
MARITLVFVLLASTVAAVPFEGVTYAGPDTLVEFTPGSGEYQVALHLGDSIKGPCRLIATDLKLFLLDQLNQRILYFDTAGSFIRQVKLQFGPADMALDSLDRIYLLDTTSNTALVTIMDGEKEVDRMKIKHDTIQRIREISIYPGEGLVFRTNYGFNKAKKVLNFDGFLSCSPTIKTFYLDKKMAFESENGVGYTDGAGFSSTTYITEVLRKPRNCLDFLDTADTIREIRGSELWLWDSRGTESITTRTFHLFAATGKTHTMLIKDLPGTYYASVHWRNVAVNCRGDVYVFTVSDDGKAYILKWSVS